MREDHFTTTEADAGRYEQQHGQADYDGPTRLEAERDEAELEAERDEVVLTKKQSSERSKYEPAGEPEPF